MANEALLLAEKTDAELDAIIEGTVVRVDTMELPEGNADEGLPDE